jgi:hypothetical protein
MDQGLYEERRADAAMRKLRLLEQVPLTMKQLCFMRDDRPHSAGKA